MKVALMKRFLIKTLGCRVNQYESEAMTEYLQSFGYNCIDDGTPIDICIVNTCAVTSKAAMQSRQIIRQLHRLYPTASIIVTGCYAQTSFDEIERMQVGCSIIGNDYKYAICESLIHGNFQNCSFPPAPQHTICNQTTFQTFPITVTHTRTRPYLKIQDGCNAFCTYCIVPYARGRSRSMQVNHVLDQLKHIHAAGYHEAVLTGINLGEYGKDLHPRISLYDLLVLIDQDSPIQRVRLSSIEPHMISSDMIELCSRSSMICHHFHIPLQSGDSDILKSMGRPYSPEDYRNLIETIRMKLPDAAIGADVLVGFPTETQTAFEKTLHFIEQLPISYLHVFPFSPRQGTPASRMQHKSSSSEIKKRCDVLRKLGTMKKNRFYEQFVGKIIDVLIEEQDLSTQGWVKGISSNYLSVSLQGNAELKNNIIPVLIQKMSSEKGLIGTIAQFTKQV
ncbi:MAG: tRNA (N(6)-L-threonylcarbamoyladenosine(37)-C(2))-methylthiotransferase MtaB [Desulfobacterales bacterium]|nr:tRNA (N(6)-L-threonylcarbamoyladenosine(37)-C(2))-methylthiotransferase MtaB [Desulfobacterales bacterium]